MAAPGIGQVIRVMLAVLPATLLVSQHRPCEPEVTQLVSDGARSGLPGHEYAFPLVHA